MTAWIVVTLVSKSATSCEIETFITAWSRTIRNCAAASTARTGHLLIGSSAEQLGLLSGELLLGQDPLLFQFAQLPELIDDRPSGSGRGGGLSGRGRLLLLFFLRRPALALAFGDTV